MAGSATPSSASTLAREDRGLRNVVVLGAAFALIFTAFQTSSFFQASLLKTLGYKDDGFYSLALLYAAMAVAIFFAPIFIGTIGPKLALFAGGCCYCLFIGSLVHVVVPVFLVASALNGVGAAALWTSQGSLLTQYSTPETRGSRSGLFWALLQTSLLFGSILAYVILPPGHDIKQHTATKLYLALLVVCCLGVATIWLLDDPSKIVAAGDLVPSHPGSTDQSRTALLRTNDSSSSPHHSPLGGSSRKADSEALSSDDVHLLTGQPAAASVPTFRATLHSIRDTFLLLKRSRPLQLVMVTTFYSGIMLTFWQGKYGEIVSGKDDSIQTLPSHFEPRLVSFLLVTIGAAETLGGVMFGRLSDRYGGTIVMVLGCTVPQLVAIFIVYANFLSKWYTPSVPIAFVAAFLLGLGDAAMNPLVYALLGDIFQEGDSSAFALYFFMRSAGAGIAFVYAAKMPLLAQLIILAVLLLAGTVSYVVVRRQIPASSSSSGNSDAAVTVDPAQTPHV